MCVCVCVCVCVGVFSVLGKRLQFLTILCGNCKHFEPTIFVIFFLGGGGGGGVNGALKQRFINLL